MSRTRLEVELERHVHAERLELVDDHLGGRQAVHSTRVDQAIHSETGAAASCSG